MYIALDLWVCVFFFGGGTSFFLAANTTAPTSDSSPPPPKPQTPHHHSIPFRFIYSFLSQHLMLKEKAPLIGKKKKKRDLPKTHTPLTLLL